MLLDEREFFGRETRWIWEDGCMVLFYYFSSGAGERSLRRIYPSATAIGQAALR